MATPEEIEDLKEGWKWDPCWDIEDTEGFEEHREELLAWRLEYEAERRKEYAEKVEARMVEARAKYGVHDNDLLLAALINMQYKIDYLREKLEELREGDA